MPSALSSGWSRFAEARRNPFVLLGLLTTAGGLAIVAQVMLDGRNSLPLALTLYLIAIALVAVTFVARAARREESPIPLWAEIGLVLLIVSLALSLRVFRLEQVPPGLHTDETVYGLEAAEIAETGSRPLWSDRLAGGRATGHAYAVAAFFKVLGVEPFPLRLVSAIAGALTVLALYLFVREAFNVRAALCSGFLLAVSRWHLHYSRIGWEIILAPMAGIAALYFLFRALRTNNPWWYAASGAALAAGMYTYASYRMIPFAFAVLLAVILLNYRLDWLRRHWLGLGVFAIVAIVVVFPMGKWAWQNQDRFNSRFEAVSVFETEEPWETLGENIGRQLAVVNYRGPPFPHQNVASKPLAVAPYAVLFALGLGLIAARFWQPRETAVILFIAAGVASVALTVPHETPHAHRAIMAAPMVALVAGVFLSEASSALARVLPGVTKVAAAALAFALLAWIAWGEMDIYFNEWATDQLAYADFVGDATLVGRSVEEQSETSDVYVSSFFYHFPQQSRIEFIAYQEREHYQQLNTARHIPASSSIRDVTYILQPGERILLPFLYAIYPDGVLEEHANPFGGTTHLSFHVSLEQLESIRGLNARYYDNTDWQGEPVLERREATLGGAEPPGVSVPFSVEWSGSILVIQSGIYHILIEGDGTGEVLVDGDDLGDRGTFLASGLHPIEIRFQQTGTGPPTLMLDDAFGGLSAVPPGVLFTASAGQNGLLASYWTNAAFQSTPAFIQLERAIYPTDAVIGPYAIQWNGWLRTDTPGTYGFDVNADDGARLIIDNVPVLDVDFTDGTAGQQSGAIELDAGYHPIMLLYWQREGRAALDLTWTPPGGQPEPIPLEALYYRFPP